MLTRDNLYPYQRRLVEFIKTHPNCAAFVDMGLGKSVSTLTAYHDMLDSFDTQHALVIAPLRVARKTWPDEVQTWAHLQDLNVIHIGGTEKQRQKALRTRADIHTLGRENTKWLIDQFISGKKQIRKWPWDTVILDESQSWKSQSSQRWKALRLARQLFPRCIELTGTPAPNGYADLWSQIYLLDRGERLGRSESAFRDRWFNVENCGDYFKYHIKPHAAAEIQAALSDIVLSLRVEDYFDLPPVIYNNVRVTLSEPMLKAYKRFERTSIVKTLAGRTITAVNAGVAYNKCLQFANGALYFDETGQFEVLHDTKIDALLETLEASTGPVLVGYGFIHDRKRIAAALERHCGKSKRWAFMESDDQLEAFSRGELDVGLIHPASAGHGLNSMHKSGGATIIWFGGTCNLEHFQQLNARLTGGIRRLGKNVVVHIIVADGTIDEEVVELLTSKAKTQDDLTRAMARRLDGEQG